MRSRSIRLHAYLFNDIACHDLLCCSFNRIQKRGSTKYSGVYKGIVSDFFEGGSGGASACHAGGEAEEDKVEAGTNGGAGEGLEGLESAAVPEPKAVAAKSKSAASNRKASGARVAARTTPVASGPPAEETVAAPELPMAAVDDNVLAATGGEEAALPDTVDAPMKTKGGASSTGKKRVAKKVPEPTAAAPPHSSPPVAAPTAAPHAKGKGKKVTAEEPAEAAEAVPPRHDHAGIELSDFKVRIPKASGGLIVSWNCA